MHTREKGFPIKLVIETLFLQVSRLERRRGIVGNKKRCHPKILLDSAPTIVESQLYVVGNSKKPRFHVRQNVRMGEKDDPNPLLGKYVETIA